MSRNGRKQDLLGRFAIYLRKRRKQERLSIRKFAERAQMPFTNIHQMEMYGKNPNLTELEMLARAFNQPLSDFLQPVIEEQAKQ